MQTLQFNWLEIGVSAEVSCFSPNVEGYDKGVEEYHIMLHVDPRGELFEAQYGRLMMAEALLQQEAAMAGCQVVFRRYFLSDAANQASFLPHDAHVSYIQQPPLDGSKIAEWLYLQKGADVTLQDGFVAVAHNGYRHLYRGCMYTEQGDSYTQTRTLLEQYESKLQQFNAVFADHCIRTWFFVRDVDSQYAGLVKARFENFEALGLTEKNHYIASTGIGGVPASTKAIVQFGAYALTGFMSEQRYHLYALSHLSPTVQYGVTFERGTVVEYGDRSNIYISGTASIDHCGQVVHVGNIGRQIDRMLENVEALLAEGDATMNDIVQMIVYLRDMGDYKLVKARFDEQFPGIPKVITWAPVCRPTWLIEMECMAIAHRNTPKYRNF